MRKMALIGAAMLALTALQIQQRPGPGAVSNTGWAVPPQDILRAGTAGSGLPSALVGIYQRRRHEALMRSQGRPVCRSAPL